MKNNILNHSEISVKFEYEKIEIDLEEFGEGYTLDNMKKMLHDFSDKNAFIRFGESSVLTVGSHLAGDYWKFGLIIFNNSTEALHTFHIQDESVITSANFFVNNKGKLCNHRHVNNPFTGYPANDICTVGVCSKSTLVAEDLSTAFQDLSENEIRSVKKK